MASAYDKPAILSPDYTAIGKGLQQFGKAAAAKKAAEAKQKAVDDKARLAAEKEKKKQETGKRKAMSSLRVDMNKLPDYNDAALEQEFQGFLNNQLDVLDQLEYESDDWFKQVEVIKNLTAKSKTGIELVNQEAKDLGETYTLSTDVNGAAVFTPKNSSIPGAALNNNNDDLTGLISDYSLNHGANITFAGGSKIVNGKLEVNTNVGLKYKKPVGTGQQTSDVFLNFGLYQDTKAKGYDIIGRTDAETYNTRFDGYWQTFGGKAYDNSFSEILNTTVDANGEITYETIKKYDKANDEVRNNILAKTNSLNVNQNDWQLMGGPAYSGNTIDVIDPNNAQHRKEFAKLLGDRLIENKGKKDEISYKYDTQDKMSEFAASINDYRANGLVGFGRINDANMPANFKGKSRLTPDEIKDLSKDFTSHTKLGKFLTDLSGDNNRYKSGVDVLNQIVTDYEAEANALGYYGPTDVLEFAAGKKSDQPGTVYPGADKIKYGDLYETSGAYATLIEWDNPDKVEDLIYKELDLSQKQRQYLKSGTAVSGAKKVLPGTKVVKQ